MDSTNFPPLNNEARQSLIQTKKGITLDKVQQRQRQKKKRGSIEYCDHGGTKHLEIGGIENWNGMKN